MPRHNRNARRVFDTRLSYKEYCKMIGISPKQRILLSRWIQSYLKWGENNMDEETQVTEGTVEAPVEEAPVEETVTVTDAPVGVVDVAPEVPAEETPAIEAPTEGTPVEEAPVEVTPADAPVEPTV